MDHALRWLGSQARVLRRSALWMVPTSWSGTAGCGGSWGCLDTVTAGCRDPGCPEHTTRPGRWSMSIAVEGMVAMGGRKLRPQTGVDPEGCTRQAVGSCRVWSTLRRAPCSPQRPWAVKGRFLKSGPDLAPGTTMPPKRRKVCHRGSVGPVSAAVRQWQDLAP